MQRSWDLTLTNVKTIEKVSSIYLQCIDSEGIPILCLYTNPEEIGIKHETDIVKPLKVTLTFTAKNLVVAPGLIKESFFDYDMGGSNGE